MFKELPINEQIRANKVRLVSSDGEQLGIIDFNEASQKASDEGMDLVMIAVNGNPPVCKIMDYGKHRYEQIKKEKEARKNQKVIALKEIQLSMSIQANDLDVKAKRAIGFLKEGNKLKVVLRMKGRERAFQNRGMEVVNNFYEIVKEYGIVDKKPVSTGRNVIMIVSPKK